jgi:hypothetical protein
MNSNIYISTESMTANERLSYQYWTNYDELYV